MNAIPYSASFHHAVQNILYSEGVFSDDKNDSGGMTKYGISKAANPSVDIRNLTIDDAISIYYKKYWKPFQLDRFFAPVSLCVFDAIVNQGENWAPKAFQLSLSVKPDGIIGTRTLEAGCKITRINFDAWLQTFNELRIQRYLGAPSFQHYGRGWLNRLNRVTIEAMNMWASGTEL